MALFMNSCPIQNPLFEAWWRSSLIPTLMRRTRTMESNGWTLADIIEENVDRLKSKTCVFFINEGKIWTYADVDDGTDVQVARTLSHTIPDACSSCPLRLLTSYMAKCKCLRKECMHRFVSWTWCGPLATRPVALLAVPLRLAFLAFFRVSLKDCFSCACLPRAQP